MDFATQHQCFTCIQITSMPHKITAVAIMLHSHSATTSTAAAQQRSEKVVCVCMYPTALLKTSLLETSLVAVARATACCFCLAPMLPSNTTIAYEAMCGLCCVLLMMVPAGPDAAEAAV